MAKPKRVGAGERLRNTMVEAFQRIRPLDREFRENLSHIIDNNARLAELTVAWEHMISLVRRHSIDIARLPEFQDAAQQAAEAKKLASDNDTLAEAMQLALSRQTEVVTEIGVASMNLKEFEDEPQQIGELMMNAALIATNWKFIVHSDDEVLADTLTGVLPTTRKSALARLSEAERDEWLNDLLEARSTKPIVGAK